MSTQTIVAPALVAVTGLIAAFFGFRIRSRGDVQLIAGYNPQRVGDPVGFARFVGNSCYAMSAVALIAALVLLTRPVATGIVMLGFAILVIMGIVVLLVSRDRYQRQPPAGPIGPDRDSAT